MAKRRKKNAYLELRDTQQKAATGRAKAVLPLLQKDKDWGLVTGSEDDYERFYRAVTRLTKKAVRLMHPDHKVSVTRGRGTGYGWVHVDITAPELDWTKHKGKAREHVSAQESTFRRETEDVLLALGIKYSTYYTDFGPGLDSYQPCLSITINQVG